MMKPGSLLLFAEPAGHVTRREFEQSLVYARPGRTRKAEEREISRSLSILLRKR
ncbi:MAG: hypothetical protein IPH20_15025 [Bacteroidales bacterium]|nr:hypothetical protein [Bacteroidales bacterium]